MLPQRSTAPGSCGSAQGPAPTRSDVAALLARLRRTLAGRVDAPGDPGYAGCLLPYQALPLAVAHVTRSEDVLAVVAAAAEHRVPVSIAPPGLSPRSDGRSGVQVSTAAFSGCEVLRQGRTARVGAGVRWQRLVDVAAPTGLAPVVGTDGRASVAGDVVAGGTGLLARSLGHPAAAIESFDVVTGDGFRRTVHAGSAPDLFWALRGGDLGLGVVTAVTLRLGELPQVSGGRFSWRGPAVREAFAAYVDWAGTAPAHVTSVATLRPAVAAGMVDRLDVDVATTGPDGLGDALAALRGAGPAGEILHHQRLHEWMRVHPGPAGSSTMVRSLPQPLGPLDDTAVQALLATVLDHHGRPAVRLHHLGGELARPMDPPAAAVDGVVGHAGRAGGTDRRDGTAAWNLVGCGVDPAAVSEPDAWPAVRSALAPWRLPRWDEAAGARRRTVHRRHDPLGLFAGPADD